MPDKRDAQLEDYFARTPRGTRRRASWNLLGMPFYDIAIGPDPDKKEIRGRAKGFIAIGDRALGVIAIGNFARGGIAIGWAALGLVSIGGIAVGPLVAVGVLAFGGLAFGGVAAGPVAVGADATGIYACGIVARGEAVIDDDRRDPAAVVFFGERGLGKLCGQGEIKGKSL